MWNAQTSEYVKDLVLTMKKEYPYYVAYTVSNTTGNDAITTYVYFSKSKITANGLHSYVIPVQSICYSLRTGNYSDRYDNYPRIETKTYSGTININPYEFIYTNAVSLSGTLQPDVTAERGLTNETFQAFSLILVGVLFVVFFSNWFTRRRNSII